jgi:hypothetical protein
MRSFLLVCLVLLFSVEAWAGKASQVFQTEEGYSLEVERSGRSIVKFHLTTGVSSEDINCMAFYPAVGTYLQPIILGTHFLTAAKRSQSDAQIGDVIPFGISEFLTGNWYIMPNACAIGITANSGNVTVIVANMGKMGGRPFTLSSVISENVGNFIKTIP